MGGHETYFYVASCTFNWNYYPTDCPRLFILLLCHRSQHLFEFCTFANSCSMFHKLYMYWGRGGTYYCNLFAARTAPQCNCIKRLHQRRDKYDIAGWMCRHIQGTSRHVHICVCLKQIIHLTTRANPCNIPSKPIQLKYKCPESKLGK